MRIKTAAFIGLVAALSLVALASSITGVVITPGTHLILEFIAATTAGLIAVIALIHHSSRYENSLLLIGTGFIGTAFLDLFHGFIAAGQFSELGQGTLSATLAWGWTASRLFLATFMFLAFMAWLIEKERGPAGRISKRVVLGSGAILAVLSIVLMLSFELPSPFSPGLIARPIEFIPGILFLAAAVGFIVKADWKNAGLDSWLIMSMLTAAVIQLGLMGLSSQNFDAAFSWAHILKIISYFIVLTGLLVSMRSMFQQARNAALKLSDANNALRVEIAVRRRIEEEAQDRENMLRAFLNNSSAVIYLKDTSGKYILANKAFEALFGLRLSDISGKTNLEVMTGGVGIEHHQRDLEVLESGKPTHTEETVPGFEGDRTYLAIRFPIEHASSGAVIMGCVATDITQRIVSERYLSEQARELARRNSELEQFAYVASHDLQEPLRMVASYTQLLERRYTDKLDEKANKYIRYAVDGVDRMQRLIHDLLLYSQADRGEEEFGPVDSGACATTALSNLEVAVQSRLAEIRFDKLPTVWADQTQITQLFQNLISNGLKFNKSESPEITVSAQMEAGLWHFTVTDNGIGMDQDSSARVFMVFQRLHNRSDYEGTGIGLALCKKIVENHGGNIWIESKEGKGSTFHFTLQDPEGKGMANAS